MESKSSLRSGSLVEGIWSLRSCSVSCGGKDLSAITAEKAVGYQAASSDRNKSSPFSHAGHQQPGGQLPLTGYQIHPRTPCRQMLGVEFLLGQLQYRHQGETPRPACLVWCLGAPVILGLATGRMAAFPWPRTNKVEVQACMQVLGQNFGYVYYVHIEF
ncbi:hypothetical protein WJX74_002021 [Apatococcus lobatus]|uniref:Uncharacterized protein n=1 Tax=Apatococcus lobatus TaxID=904363 RepID=A0AAW1QTB4_9CHLO